MARDRLRLAAARCTTSPLRDGGYDISDYKAIHPDYGTLEDVRAFIDAAHQRGIRVIADLVMNHTSLDHPWFQESRSSPDSPKRNWYVWSETADRYRDARIIFLDTETSNWTWDDQAGAYYWHRFFSHQPDLNYDEPAGPARRCSTSCASGSTSASTASASTPSPTSTSARAPTARTSPRRTSSSRRVRATVDAEYPDRVLLAEANQWPADVVEYFGDGDECHMAFHFPVMPRMFMALRREEAAPIIETLEQHARASPRTASGACSSATTTS